MQGTAGLFCGSAALVADAAHSVSDLLSDAVTLATLHYCKRPTDETHPYGSRQGPGGESSGARVSSACT